MNKVEELAAKIKAASDAYYNTDHKLMSDEEYDNLVKEYYELTQDVIVGSAPRVSHVVAVDHKYDDLAGTLEKSKDINEVVTWLTKHKELTRNEYDLIVTLKYDGNSVIEEYEDGKLKVALTRGEDGKGKDVTDLMNRIPVKYMCAIEGNVGVKVEVIMTYDNFDKYIRDTGKEYANPRSVVAGILNSDDGYKYAKYLTVVPLWMRGEDITDRNDEVLEVNKMSEIQVEHTYRVDGTLEEVTKDIKSLYDEYNARRMNDTLEFMIDGIVIEFADKEIREKLGFTNSKKDIPKYAIALKFPYMEKTSKVTKIEFWVSENGTGLITPVCYFEPVEFIGATHQKQSLQNYKRFKELSLGVGSPILVQLRNDVLTYIEKLETDDDITPIPFADKCPVCGGEIIIDVNDDGEETRARCGNPACPTKTKGMIVNYLTKIGVKGVNTATVEALYEAGVIKDIPSMYTCKESDMCNVLGPIAGKKAKEALFAVTSIFDYQLIGSLNIDNFGRSTAQLLFKEITWFEFTDMLDNPSKLRAIMMDIDGIGPKKTAIFLKEIVGLRPIIDKLAVVLTIKSYKNTLKLSDKSYSFVITGKLSRKRDEIVEELKQKGHKVTGSVTKNTDYLINNDINSTTGKNKKAKELGIPIITEDELSKLI